MNSIQESLVGSENEESSKRSYTEARNSFIFYILLFAGIIILLQYGELESNMLMCIYVNFGFILTRALFKAYEMYSYAFYRNALDYKISYYFIYFSISIIWSGYLIYTNVVFYSNFGIYQSDSPIFAAFIIVIFIGYFVIFETAIIILLSLIIIILIYFTNTNRQVPIESELLDKLATVKYDTESFPQDQQCLICFNDYANGEDITFLPCDPKHHFHNQCISQWLKTNNICPVCRSPITLASLRRVNLSEVLRMFRSQ